MFKKLPFLVATLFAFAAFGQTIVSTSPENRNVVLEEFTGIYCVFCPEGHTIAQGIQDANPDRVSLINIHTGSFANPSGNAPDFRTPFGAAIAGQGGITGYPAGTVNRHVFSGRGQSGGSTAMGRGSWATSANDMLAMPSYVNVAVEAELNATTNMMEIHVEAYYTGNSPESTNRLNVAIVQNNTKGPQTGGGQGNNYNHMHRLVDMPTGQWGQIISETTQGTFIDKTFSYDVKNHNNGIPLEYGDLEVIVFITETKQEIITGNRATPTIESGNYSKDARARFVEEISTACYGEEVTFSPKVNIQNLGSDPLTSVSFEYIINGESYNHTWTGNMEPLKSATVKLPPVTLTLQETNTIKVILENDDNNSNNTLTVPFGAVPTTGYVDVKVNAGQHSDQLRWRIRTSTGSVLHLGGPFAPGEVYEERFQLDDGCYEFIVIDSTGDNDGSISLTDHHGKVVFDATGWIGGPNVITPFYSNGFLDVNDFDLEAITLYPNPAQDIIFINNGKGATVQMFDVLGKSVLTKTEISNNEGIQVSTLQSGVYFMKISKDGKLTTKKFVISR